MDIRSGLDGLQSLLGVTLPEAAAVPRAATGSIPAAGKHSSDHATLSSAGTEIAQAAAGDGVRASTVAAVQMAIAAGAYHIPAAAVAGKIIDAMLTNEK